MKRKRLTALALIALPIIAIVLESLPYGVVLNFGYPSETGEILLKSETYSYFSLMPFGYAVFGPLLAALLTCVTAVTTILSLLLKKNWTKAISVLCIVAALASASPLLLGLRYFTALGAVITILLIVDTFIALKLRRQS